MHIAPEFEQRWRDYLAERKPGLIEAFSITLTKLDHGLVKASMPVGEIVKQPFGILHGGASVALAETLASLGSWMLVSPETNHIAGLEINANHLRPVSDGSVHAEATILHQGRTSHVWHIQITDDRGRPVCISRCTIAIISSGTS